MLGKMSIG